MGPASWGEESLARPQAFETWWHQQQQQQQQQLRQQQQCQQQLLRQQQQQQPFRLLRTFASFLFSVTQQKSYFSVVWSWKKFQIGRFFHSFIHWFRFHLVSSFFIAFSRSFVRLSKFSCCVWHKKYCRGRFGLSRKSPDEKLLGFWQTLFFGRCCSLPLLGSCVRVSDKLESFVKFRWSEFTLWERKRRFNS